MRLTSPAVDAVLMSRLEPHLRFLALVLAMHANDDGTSIYPGVTTLKEYTGLKESTIRHQLGEIVKTRVLVRDGYHVYSKHKVRVRQYRLDLARLRSYQPNMPPAAGSDCIEPASRGRFNRTSAPSNLPRADIIPAAGGIPTCLQRPENMPPAATNSSGSVQDQQEDPGADAPASSLRGSAQPSPRPNILDDPNRNIADELRRAYRFHLGRKAAAAS